MKYIILILALYSCSASKHLEKALHKDKIGTLKKLREIAPCITTATDTVTINNTDTLTVSKLDTVKCDSVGQLVVTQHDTIKVVKTQFKTVTKHIKDSAEVIIIQADNTKIKALNDSLEKANDKLRSQRNKAIGILLFLFVIVAAYIYIKLRKW